MRGDCGGDAQALNCDTDNPRVLLSRYDSKFHKAHGEAHHEHERKGGLQRISSVNENIMAQQMSELMAKNEPKKLLHAGTWLVEQPDHFVNCESL